MILLIAFLTMLTGQTTVDHVPLVTLANTYDLKSMVVSERYITLLLRSEPYVRVFDHSATPIAHWGRKGGGPDEFTSVQDIATLDDSVWVLNKLPGKILVFSMTGKLQQNINMNDLTFPTRIRPLGKRCIIQEGGMRLDQNDLLLLGDKAKSKLHIIDFGKIESLKSSSGIPLRVTSPYASRDHWDVSHEGLLIFSGKEQADLNFLDMNGKIVEKWDLENRKYRIPESAKNIWLDEKFPKTSSGGFPTGSWRREAEKLPLPEFYPAVMKLVVDHDRLWVLKAYTDKNQLWQCYQKGVKVNTLTLSNSYLVHAIYNGRVYATDLEDDDTPIVVLAMR